MKNLLLIGVMLLLSVSSCVKDDSKNVTPSSTSTSSVNTTGTIQFVNNSSNPYKLYINGAYKTQLNGKSSITYTVSYGSYNVRALQSSGYVLYASEYQTDGVVSASRDIIFSFP